MVDLRTGDELWYLVIYKSKCFMIIIVNVWQDTFQVKDYTLLCVTSGGGIGCATECTIAMGIGRKQKPLLHLIPMKKPFQILWIDVMELPKTSKVISMTLLYRISSLVYPTPGY